MSDSHSVALSVKLSDISWDSVQNVNIAGRKLEIVTHDGAFAFDFSNVEKMSEALLILALKGTQSVEFVDDCRFNPARILGSLR